MTPKSPSIEVRRLLAQSGIDRPDQFDLEAIAHANNLKVRYANLDGCAANIVGYGDRGVITVDKSSSMGRKRFSLAHEIGHWIYDRNRGVNMCKSTDMGRSWSGKSKFNPIERRANEFAAELLLPRDWFISACREKPTSFDSVTELAAIFNSSLSATALRFVEIGDAPSMLLYFNGNRMLKRFKVSRDIEGVLYPHKLMSDTTNLWKQFTADGLFRSESVEVDGDAWIDHPRAFELTIVESAIRVQDEFLVLLQILDERTLLDILK